MPFSSKAFALSILLLAVPLAPPSFSAPAPIVEAKRLEAKVLGLIRARRFTEALPLAKRALKIRERALGADHQSLVLFLNRLAFIHTTQKNSKEASAFRARAMEMQKKLAARRRAVRAKIGEAKRLNEKAGRLYGAGHYKKTEPLLRRSLGIRENTLGPRHPDVAQSLENYAALLRKTGRATEASKMVARAKAIRAAMTEAPSVEDNDRDSDAGDETFHPAKTFQR